VTQTTLKNLLELPVGFITRLRTNKSKDTFNDLIQSIWTNVNFKETTNSISDY
jgi:hypothetical protein